MADKDDPKTFLSKKLADGTTDPEQVTNLESKEQREYYRFLTVYGNMGFDFLINMRNYEQRMNMSKEKMRPEQLVEAIVGLEQKRLDDTGLQGRMARYAADQEKRKHD